MCIVEMEIPRVHGYIHVLCMYVCMYVCPQRMHGISLPFRMHQRYKYDSQLTCDGRCQCVLEAVCP